MAARVMAVKLYGHGSWSDGSAAIWPGAHPRPEPQGSTLRRARPCHAFACDRSEHERDLSGRGKRSSSPPPIRPTRWRRTFDGLGVVGRLLRARTRTARLEERLRVEVLAALACVVPRRHGRDLLVGQQPRNVLGLTRERRAKERTNALPVLLAIRCASELLGEIVRAHRRLCHCVTSLRRSISYSYYRIRERELQAIDPFERSIDGTRSIDHANTIYNTYSPLTTRNDTKDSTVEW